jgi:hypothetical protein
MQDNPQVTGLFSLPYTQLPNSYANNFPVYWNDLTSEQQADLFSHLIYGAVHVGAVQLYAANITLQKSDMLIIDPFLLSQCWISTLSLSDRQFWFNQNHKPTVLVSHSTKVIRSISASADVSDSELTPSQNAIAGVINNNVGNLNTDDTTTSSSVISSLVTLAQKAVGVADSSTPTSTTVSTTTYVIIGVAILAVFYFVVNK